MANLALFLAAAVAEISGCFAFWLYFKQDRSIGWLVGGILSLALFAWLLACAEIELAGRAYAAYGGMYIAASLLWLWLMENTRPDRWDLVGAYVCLAGAAIIIFGPR
jgi:small multidrug resistance family-3 protein